MQGRLTEKSSPVQWLTFYQVTRYLHKDLSDWHSLPLQKSWGLSTPAHTLQEVVRDPRAA